MGITVWWKFLGHAWWASSFQSIENAKDAVSRLVTGSRAWIQLGKFEIRLSSYIPEEELRKQAIQSGTDGLVPPEDAIPVFSEEEVSDIIDDISLG